MKKLLDILNKQEKYFVKGGKLETFSPLYEAAHTFMFSPKNVTTKGPHVRDSLDTKRYMLLVVMALVDLFLHNSFRLLVVELLQYYI